MKHEPRDASEYPDFIQAEAKGGEIVEYVRVSVAKDRENKIIKAFLDVDDQIINRYEIYKEAELEELK